MAQSDTRGEIYTLALLPIYCGTSLPVEDMGACLLCCGDSLHVEAVALATDSLVIARDTFFDMLSQKRLSIVE